MATCNFRRFGFGIFVCLVGIWGAESSVAAVELGLQNGDGLAWVHRRAENDKDAADAYAVVLRMDSVATGRLWYFKNINTTHYTESSAPIVVAGTIDPKGTGERSRLIVTFKTDTDGDGIVDTSVGYLTLYQGRAIKKDNNGQRKLRRAGQRSIFRWNAAFADSLKAQEEQRKTTKKDKSTVNCDDPPDDAPMEEEETPLPPPDEAAPLEDDDVPIDP